jgi:hypothetical protein
MRAHTITTISRGRRSARRRRAIALALGICALAIPAAASAAPIDAGAIAGEESGQSADGAGASLYANPTTPNATLGEESGQSADGAGYSAYANPTTPNATLGADGLGEPTLLTGSPTATSDGFDWVSALVGAGAAMSLVALGGAALLTVRRRAPVPPPAPTS